VAGGPPSRSAINRRWGPVVRNEVHRLAATTLLTQSDPEGALPAAGSPTGLHCRLWIAPLYTAASPSTPQDFTINTTRGPRVPPSRTIGNVTYHSSPLSLNRTVIVHTKIDKNLPTDLLLDGLLKLTRRHPLNLIERRRQQEKISH
jgi:hypothetical protein